MGVGAPIKFWVFPEDGFQKDTPKRHGVLDALEDLQKSRKKNLGKSTGLLWSPHFCPLDVPKKNTWSPSIEESLTENGYPLRNRREAEVMAAVPSRPKAVQIVTSSSFVPPISQISCKKSGLWSSESKRLESPWIANAGTAATDIVPLSYGDTTTLGLNFDLDIQASKRHQETYKFSLGKFNRCFLLKPKKHIRKPWSIGRCCWIIDCFQIKICVRTWLCGPPIKGASMVRNQCVFRTDSEGMWFQTS